MMCLLNKCDFQKVKFLSLILFESGSLVLCGFLTMEVLEFLHSL